MLHFLIHTLAVDTGVGRKVVWVRESDNSDPYIDILSKLS